MVETGIAAFPAPFQGSIVLVGDDPGRRYAADAASLCPGLCTVAPSGLSRVGGCGPRVSPWALFLHPYGVVCVLIVVHAVHGFTCIWFARRAAFGADAADVGEEVVAAGLAVTLHA